MRLPLVPAIALIALLAACSTPRQPPAETPPSTPVAAKPETAIEPAPETPTPKPSTTPPRRGSLAGKIDPKKLAAQLGTRPITLNTRCNFRNETGYSGQAMVDVVNGDAKQISVIVNVPQQGHCLFDMSGFQQTKRGTMVEIRHPKDGCTARIWEQGSRTTLAFSNCASRCSPPASFQYVWPVLIDRPSGNCD